MTNTISRGTGFVLVFIYVRLLDNNDIGIRTLVYGASSFITLFYTLGLDNAFLRYFMDKEYERDKDTILSTAFLFTIVTGLAFFICAFFFSTQFSIIIARNPSNGYIVRLIFAILIFDTAVIYPMLILRAENKLMYYSFVGLSRFVLFISLNLLFVWYLHRGLNGIFEANLIAMIVVAVLLSPVLKSYLTGRISFRLLKRMLLFGIPTIFILFFMYVIDISDRYLIEYYMDKEAVGRYTIAYTLGMAGIMVFVNSFRTAWQPFFMSLKDNPDIGRLFSRVATYYAVFIGMVYLGMTLFREEIFHLYAPGQSVSLARIIPLVSLAYLFYGFYIIMLAGVFIREKTKFLPIAPIIGALLNVGFNLVFIPRFGILGAALTTLIAYCAMVAILFVIAHKVYHVQYEFSRLGTVFLVTALTIAVSFFFGPDSVLKKVLMNSTLMFIPPLVYWFSGFLQPVEIMRLKEIRNYATKTLRRKGNDYFYK